MVNCALRSLYAGKDIQVSVVCRAAGPPRTGLGAMRRENCLDKHESNLDISLVQPVAYSLYEHLESDAHASAARTGDFSQVNAWFRFQWTHTV